MSESIQVFYVSPVTIESLCFQSAMQSSLQTDWNSRLQRIHEESADSIVDRDYATLRFLASKQHLSNDKWSLWFFFRRRLILADEFSNFMQWLEINKLSATKDS